MWARRRAARQERLDRVAAEAIAEFEARVSSMLATADESHQALLELRELLARELADINGLLAPGGGMPVEMVRAQLEPGDDALAQMDRISAEFTAVRVQVIGKGAADRETLVPLLEDLGGFVEGMGELADNVFGAAEATTELRVNLQDARKDLAPLRARLQPALRAAEDELAATRGAPGWHVRQVALATLGDRLAALEEGRVWPTPEKTTVDLYQELEHELATLRDEIAQTPS
ncbi:hypothetical protein AB0D49_19560 [Streptomyces sp. NPDC048290]|uniref:hypothetical protein n=1 Tax=Streptomyces sp. NPDC048290 TaxID=3155811 RepID=UPI00341460E6